MPATSGRDATNKLWDAAAGKELLVFRGHSKAVWPGSWPPDGKLDMHTCPDSEENMHPIDMQTWPRREHFQLFSTFNHPHFGMCANVDVTACFPYIKQHRHSLTVAVAYLIAQAANAVPEFRYRIRAGQVIEHEIVNPSFTILVSEDLFSFCTIDYVEAFPEFAQRAAASIAYVRAHPSLENDSEEDDVLYMSPIPWVSFTSFEHPMQQHPADSIPRFAWGKIFEEGTLLKMPLAAQGHHAVMDGIHMGRFYEKIQDCLHHPEITLGNGMKRTVDEDH